MPNIRQQEKRVRQAARQRTENLRWRSTAKTLMRRLKDAVDAGDQTVVEERHRELVSWLDKAAASGALHKNTAARRKAQADRLLAEALVAPVRLGRAAARHVDERTLELEVGRQAGPALRRSVELREPDDRVAELLGREVRSLGERLLRGERMHLQPAAASRGRTPSSASFWQRRTRPTWLTSEAMIRISSLDRAGASAP